MSPLILVVDDEPDVEVLFRQHFGVTSALAVSPWSSPIRFRPHLIGLRMRQKRHLSSRSSASSRLAGRSKALGSPTSIFITLAIVIRPAEYSIEGHQKSPCRDLRSDPENCQKRHTHRARTWRTIDQCN